MPDLNIHEVPTGTKCFDWEVPEEWAITEAYIEGPDGKKIVAANWQRQPSLFDAKTGHSLIQKAGKHIGHIWVVDWSPNGQRFLTASADNTTNVWTLPQNQF